MLNMLFSLTALGENIVSGLTGAFGKFWYLFLINAIGAVAIILKICETQNKNRKTILTLAILNWICWITYFILNGDFTSATVNIICFTQSLVFIQRGKHKWADSKFFLFFFLAVQIGAGFFTWKSFYSLFSICAGLMSTIAYFVISEKTYRYFFLASILLWICNGIVYFYPIALIHDTFATVSIILAIIRYNFLGKDQKTTEQKD